MSCHLNGLQFESAIKCVFQQCRFELLQCTHDTDERWLNKQRRWHVLTVQSAVALTSMCYHPDSWESSTLTEHVFCKGWHGVLVACLTCQLHSKSIAVTAFHVSCTRVNCKSSFPCLLHSKVNCNLHVCMVAWS